MTMDSRRRAATVGAQEGDLEARLAAATVHRRAPLASTAAKPTSRLEESDEHVVDYTGDDADANVEAGAHGSLARRVAEQAATIRALQAERAAQAAELQQLLLSSLQQRQAAAAAVAGRGSDAQTAASAVAEAQRGLGGLRACVRANVEAEADLHRVAAEHADYLRALDDRHPNGFADVLSERERRRLRRHEEALGEAAEAKGRATALLDALIHSLDRGLAAAAAAVAGKSGTAGDGEREGGHEQQDAQAGVGEAAQQDELDGVGEVEPQETGGRAANG